MAREDSVGNPTPRQALPASPGFWTRVQTFDGRLSIVKGFTAVTLLTGFFGGYFQYLNSYEDKVSTLAKADMQSATSTFVEISNAFAEAEMLQQLIYFDFKALLDAGTDAGEKGMVTQAGNSAFDSYVKARTALRQNSSVFAHKAEIYIDWASDLGRDPATQQALDGDPLTETLLGNYDFDCDAPRNFPNFAGGNRAAPAPAAPRCRGDYLDVNNPLRISLCARRPDTGEIDPNRPAITIDWQSAKHHVLVMHYCFEATHSEIHAVRIWASKNEVGDDRVSQFRANEERYKSSLDGEVVRLNAFMTVAMSQLERIRLKYRPSGFFCHVPLVRDAIGMFSTRCTPIGTATR
jgi:hypothetical protein